MLKERYDIAELDKETREELGIFLEHNKTTTAAAVESWCRRFATLDEFMQHLPEYEAIRTDRVELC